MDSYLQAMLGGAGALLVGFIASPAVELLKTGLLAKASRSERKRELIAKLRLTLGHMDAFSDYLNRAVPNEKFSTTMGPEQLVAWKEANEFSLEPIRSYVSDLIRLELDISLVSGVGQSLAKRLLLLFSAAEQVKRLKTIKIKTYDGLVPSDIVGEKPISRYIDNIALANEAVSVISHYKSCELSVRRFIAGPYAQKLNINSISLVVDKDIFAWDVAMGRHDSEMHLSEARRLFEKMQNDGDLSKKES